MGSDASGTFWPDSPISRGAAAAMLTRMVDPSLRLTPAWSLISDHSAAGTTLGDLVESAAYIAAPSTGAEMVSLYRMPPSPKATSNPKRLCSTLCKISS